MLGGLNNGSIVWHGVDVVVVTGELISGFLSSAFASSDGWPLSAGLDLGDRSWVGVLESVISDGSINNSWVLAVVVTGEIIRGNWSVLALSAFSDGWPFGVKFNSGCGSKQGSNDESSHYYYYYYNIFIKIISILTD